MIFVTVGTHEQPFDRLIKEVDRLITTGQLQDDVFFQTGYSTYFPANSRCQTSISHQLMDYYMQHAEVIVCHGGPGTIMQALQYSKIPIVVPRLPEFNEHVDDHQLYFCRRMRDASKIHLVEKIEDLGHTIMVCRSSAKNKIGNELERNRVDFVNRLIELVSAELKQELG